MLSRLRNLFLTCLSGNQIRVARTAYRSYQRAGVEGVLLMDISGMDHRKPSAAKLTEAIAFLDDT